MVLKTDGMSMDIEQAEHDKLQSLFPQCFKDGKLDIEPKTIVAAEEAFEDSTAMSNAHYILRTGTLK